MHRPIHVSPERAACFLGLIVALLVASGIASAYGSEGVERYFVMRVLFRLFYLNEEANLPAYFSALQWLLGALLTLFIGVVARRRADPYASHWLVLGLVFFLMSVDEAASLHETVGVFIDEARPTSGYFAYGWVWYGIAFVAAFVVTFARFLFHLPSRARNVLILAGAVYVLGALGVEMLSAALEQELSALGYQMVVAVEEFCEMAGLVLLIYGLLGHIDARVGRVALHIEPPPDLGDSRVQPIAASTAPEVPRLRWPAFTAAGAVAAVVVAGVVAPVLTVQLSRRGEAKLAPTGSDGSSFERSISGELGPGDRRADDGSYVDVLPFLFPTNTAVVISLESTDFDPYLAVVDGAGRNIAHNDDEYPGSHNARVQFVTRTGGAHTLVANSFRADAVGRYRLHVAADSRDQRHQPSDAGFPRQPAAG